MKLILALLLVAGFHFTGQHHKPNSKPVMNSREDGKPILLPSSFIDGERICLKIQTMNGDTVLGFCDTGGGISMAMPPALDKLGLKAKVKKGNLKGILPVKYILFTDMVKDANIPVPQLPPGLAIKRHGKQVAEPFLFVPKIDGETKFMNSVMKIDVFLAQNFFMGKAWTFDYIHKKVWVNTPIPASEEGNASVQKAGFKENDKHEKIYGHPSMYIEVNGEKIDVLFDIGATIVLSDSGKKALKTTKNSIGGSFIAASIFDKWRAQHPDWKHYEKADMNRDIIEVPKVNIGGHEVGPVLFARRPDEAWSKGMISSMDKVVKGAIGGSGLKYLKVTIDYNSDLIKFEQ